MTLIKDCASHGSKHNTLLVAELSAKGPCLHCLARKKIINKRTFRRKQLKNDFFFFFFPQNLLV